MKKYFTKEVVIGICVIAAIVILVIGIDYLKGINVFKPANFYYAQYENVMGLETAAPVTIEGYKIGQVREIIFNYENPGKIDVLLSLNKNLKVPVDSKAVIGSTLLSGSYIEIKLGKSQEMIEVGGQIPTEIVPDLMTSLGDQVMPAVSSILPKVDSLLLSLNRLASDEALLASLKNMETITKNIDHATSRLDVMMSSQVPGILGNVNGVALNLDTITNDLMVLSAQLKQLPINSTMDNVNELTANLMHFSDQLNDKKSTLGMLMNDPELYNRLNRVVADVDSLIVDIQKNPKRYISIKLL